MTVTKKRLRFRAVAVASAAVAASAVLAACGGDSEPDASSPTATAASPEATATRAAVTATPVPATPATASTPTVAPEAPTAPAPAPTKAGPPAPPPPTSAPPPPAPTVPPPPATGVAITINGVNTAFSPRGGTTQVGAPTTITFNNKDVDITHDLVLYDPAGAQIAATDLAEGPIVQAFTFTPTAAGSYGFKCSVHPREMTGVITVQ